MEALPRRAWERSKFARNTGKVAVIGSLSNIEAIVQGKAGSRISTAQPGITYL
jgi:carbamate kinase